MDKIGVGIVTCNRPSFFLKSFKSIPKEHNIVIVNDGAQFEDWEKLVTSSNIKYIHNEQNLGVGKSKNVLFKELLSQDCDHIFLIEDDIIVKDPKVFQKYIEARNVTGIQHFNFGYHGPANRGMMSRGAPSPRFVVDYGKVKIAINANSVGAFCYYTREVLLKVGLLDEQFLNAFEHVDHDYRMFQAGFFTPYWNFADIADSCNYLDEIECSENSSSIRPRGDWKDNIIKGAQIFKTKHNYAPAWENKVPDSTEEQVKEVLRTMYKKYAK